MTRFKRSEVLRAMVFAGYHRDSATWTRLYIENRIGVVVAREHYQKGRTAAAKGVRCDCHDCKTAKKEEEARACPR